MDLEEALKPAKHFEALIKQALERGYWHPLLESDQTYWNPIPFQSMRSIAREVFKQMKRPFVRLYGLPENHLTVVVPKRKYLAPIINHLHLVAGELHQAPVVAWHGETYWHFQINDREIATHFVNVHLKTPEVRRAMRLPAEVA